MTATTRSGEKELAGFIGKFDRDNQSLIRAARRRMRRLLPTANEIVYDNYNFLVIGYSPTERPSDAVFSLAAAANGLNLFFLRGARLADPGSLLQGAGKQTRFVRVPDAKLIDQPEVARLMDAALAAAKPMPSRGRGRIVIKSVSAKQRPRRRAE